MIRPLWSHQSYAISETLRLIASGVRSLCITSPTGMGKATIIVKLLEAFVAMGHNCVVFTNRKLLTEQLLKTISGDGIHIGCRAAGYEAWTDHSAPVQICSMQTEFHRVLLKRDRAMKRLATAVEAHADHSLCPATIVITDEAHLNSGDVMCDILCEYQEKYGATIIGVTATPLGVSHVYEELLVAGNNSSGRECGALVMAKSYEPSSFDIWKVRRTKTGAYNQAEMEEKVKAIWSQHVVGQIFDSWKQINPDGKQSLGFAPGVKESIGLAMDFERRGVTAAHIDGQGLYVDGQYYHTTDPKDRDELFARSEAGEIKMVFNRFVLREGVDMPWVECLSLACPIASLLSYVQTLGRGLRACTRTGKTELRIIDHAATIRMHGSANMDRDQQWIANYHKQEDTITKERLAEMRDPNSAKEPEPITCPECGLIRRSGPKCTGCGFQHTKSTRKVIQEDGSLKLTAGDVFPKRHTKLKPDTYQQAERAFHRCRNAKRPMTFNQMRALMYHELHYWPPLDCPFMPKNKADWSRKIREVPMSDLYPKTPPKA